MEKSDIEKLVIKTGGKKEAAKLLGVTIRYVEMLMAGKKPGKFLEKIIRMSL